MQSMDSNHWLHFNVEYLELEKERRGILCVTVYRIKVERKKENAWNHFT